MCPLRTRPEVVVVSSGYSSSQSWLRSSRHVAHGSVALYPRASEVKVASAAWLQPAPPVTSASRTNSDSACPCAIPEYQGGDIVEAMPEPVWKVNGYGYHHAPRDTTLRFSSRSACRSAMVRNHVSWLTR